MDEIVFTSVRKMQFPPEADWLVGAFSKPILILTAKRLAGVARQGTTSLR